MDSLCKTFDKDYVGGEIFNDPEPQEDIFNEKENTMDYVKGIKRKRIVVHNNDDGKFSCQDCDYKTNQSSHLKQHVEGIHEGVCYKCEQCDYKGTTRSDLKRHVENRHNGIFYSCDQCSHKARTKSNLKVHVQYKHDGIVIPCRQCDFKGRDRGRLNRHMKSKHYK